VTAELGSWHDLYMTVGAAAATLVGLLFVGLSLHIGVVVTHPDVRSLARATLTDFFVVLLVGIAVLQPTADRFQLSDWLIAVAAVSLILLARPLLEGLSGAGRTLGVGTVAARFGVSIVGLAGLIACAALIAADRVTDGLDLLLLVVVLLLVVSVRNTWDLLVTVAAREVLRPGEARTLPIES